MGTFEGPGCFGTAKAELPLLESLDLKTHPVCSLGEPAPAGKQKKVNEMKQAMLENIHVF